MICKDLKMLFVHVPKTAGQSIERFFLNLYGLTWDPVSMSGLTLDQQSQFLLGDNPNPNQGPEKLGHLTAAEYIEFGYITKDAFTEYFKFAFVRNPWDRLVSEYYFHGYNCKYSFKDFLKFGLPEPGRTSPYRHIIPQYDYLYSSQGELLVDFIGRFENLQSDFNAICNKLNIQRTKLPHVNVSKSRGGDLQIIKRFFSNSKRKDYITFYDDESLEIVSKMYEKDIQTFGYRFRD